jgi:hypothetical protein
MEDNPYSSPHVTNSPQSAANPGGLGSLSQKAREKHLTSARRILIIIGTLNLALNGVLISVAPSMARSQVQEEVRSLPPGQVADPARVQAREELIRNYLFIANGCFAAASAGLIGLGLLVKKYPVPATVAGLVLYLCVVAASVYLNGVEYLAQGAIFKIIIVAALAKAIQAASAYESERRADAARADVAMGWKT